MFLDMIILLVRNENWPQANLHVTKENKSFKKTNCQQIGTLMPAMVNLWVKIRGFRYQSFRALKLKGRISSYIHTYMQLKQDFIDFIFLIDHLKRQDFLILDGISKVLIIAVNNNEKQTL